MPINPLTPPIRYEMEPYGAVDSLISPQPIRGHPKYGSWKTPSCDPSIRPHGEREGAVLLQCRLLAYLPEVFAELVGRTARCWSFGGANGASAWGLVVSGYCTCYSISAWRFLCWCVSCYQIRRETSGGSELVREVESLCSRLPPPSALMSVCSWDGWHISAKHVIVVFVKPHHLW